MTPTTEPQSSRVRVRNDHRVTGTVIEVLEDGLVMWVGNDGFCHFSAPDWIEPEPKS